MNVIISKIVNILFPCFLTYLSRELERRREDNMDPRDDVLISGKN